ncbi:hypothetical protein [Luteibacter sp. UNC138MFCol5.1]|uniref:hypothetical protein n=1 Tax=Luteibacter sp. UNC138MFCol5.1 TaxID=1502774 RepID=UPI000B7CE0C9|nr:hypothetical protein [Luteibacter sp. UNC138MFCol5.1]
MMKRVYVSLLALAMSGSAAAAIEQARSTKFFDESGALVGQQLALCSNFQGSYGNIHTAYHMTEVSNCIGRDQHPASIVPGTHITAYTLPGGLTIQQVCTYAQCAPASQTELEAYWNIADYGPYNQ